MKVYGEYKNSEATYCKYNKIYVGKFWQGKMFWDLEKILTAVISFRTTTICTTRSTAMSIIATLTATTVGTTRIFATIFFFIHVISHNRPPYKFNFES